MREKYYSHTPDETVIKCGIDSKWNLRAELGAGEIRFVLNMILTLFYKIKAQLFLNNLPMLVLQLIVESNFQPRQQCSGV